MFHFIQVIKESMGKGTKKRSRIRLKPLHVKMDYNLVNVNSK